MHASREEMLALQRAVYPLTRAMAARLAQRRRRRHRGHLDFRKTVRESLSYGGVPVEPKFRNPHPSKPEIMVVADISGSVASFARFTLQFVYAMASQFSKVRSWVFIDGIDEVTRFFQEADDVLDAVQRVNTEADVVWVDGHSDYGHAFETWHRRHYAEITPKSSIILLGDARNNYHASEAWVVDAMRKRGRHVYWLDPEPRAVLGHRRLDRLRVRSVLRRRLRVPQPAPAPAVRRPPSPKAEGSFKGSQTPNWRRRTRVEPRFDDAAGAATGGGSRRGRRCRRGRRAARAHGGGRLRPSRPTSSAASCAGSVATARSSGPVVPSATRGDADVPATSATSTDGSGVAAPAAAETS